MNVEIENYMRNDGSARYKAISGIPKGKFAEFFKKIAPKRDLNQTKTLIVEIFEEDMIDELEINFKFAYRDHEEEYVDLFVLPSLSSSVRYVFNLFGCTSINNQIEKEFTTLWQQFISENLGKKFYKKLIAADIKKSLDDSFETANDEQDNLIRKLVANKQHLDELEERKAQFEKDYGDVLDIHGEVLPLDETDIKKA